MLRGLDRAAPPCGGASSRAHAGLAAIALALAWPATAHADENDLVLSRLTEGSPGALVPQNAQLRGLASQLGVVLAPHLLTPADTLGFGGFQMTVNYTTTTIDTDASYWRARAGSSPVPGSMSTVGFFARKGFWFPVPSIELGGGVTHLVDSRIWTGQLYAKLAVVEGFHGLPLPSFAARGGVSRMMTQNQLDLTVASLDVTVSKHIGIGGTWRLDPFAGWNLLMIVPRSEVIDGTPNIDQLAPGNGMDSVNTFVFREQDTIYRHRFFVGAKAQFSIVQLALEASFALAGSSLDDQPSQSVLCEQTATTEMCDSKDPAAAQRTISLSAGVDF